MHFLKCFVRNGYCRLGLVLWFSLGVVRKDDIILSYPKTRKADKIILSGTRQAGKEAWLFSLTTRAGRMAWSGESAERVGRDQGQSRLTDNPQMMMILARALPKLAPVSWSTISLPLYSAFHPHSPPPPNILSISKPTPQYKDDVTMQ